MGRRRGRSKRTKASVAAGDRITGLPLELRGRIVSVLHYWQVVQLSALSRPWRHIHHHTPVVKIDLGPGLLDNHDSILAVRVALARRAQDPSASKVDTLKLAFFAEDLRMRRHANRIIALADAREIHIDSPYHPGHEVQDAWTLHLPHAARSLTLYAPHQFVSIAGPGAAALWKLNLNRGVLREWSHLQSLRSLTLISVAVEAPFAPGQWCPLLQELGIFHCKIEHARVDICLPHLRSLMMISFDVCPHGQHDGHITVDAPEMETLSIWASERTEDLKSFTLRAPKLRFLVWGNQFAERVHIDVGRPGSVKVGEIEFTSVSFGKIKKYWDQMMQMLQGLLPNVPRESVADIARPYMTPEECPEAPDSGSDDDTMEKKLSCDLGALMRRDSIWALNDASTSAPSATT